MNQLQAKNNKFIDSVKQGVSVTLLKLKKASWLQMLKEGFMRMGKPNSFMNKSKTCDITETLGKSFLPKYIVFLFFGV